MKRYFLVVLFLFYNAAVFGIAVPYLISAASTELLLVGILAVVITLPIDVLLIKSLFKTGEKV